MAEQKNLSINFGAQSAEFIQKVADIKASLTDLNLKLAENKEEVKLNDAAYKDLQKQIEILEKAQANLEPGSAKYKERGNEIKNLVRQMEELAASTANLKTEELLLQTQINNGNKVIKGQFDELNNVGKSSRGTTTDLTRLFTVMTTGNVSASTLSRAFTGMAGTIGVAAAAVGLFIKAWNDYSKAQEEADKRAEKAMENMRRAAEASKSEYDELAKLTAEYEKLGLKSSLTAEEKDKLTTIQEVLNSKYLTEAERIDLLNGKYTDNIILLREMSKEKLEAMKSDADASLIVSEQLFNNFDRNNFINMRGGNLKSREAFAYAASQLDNVNFNPNSEFIDITGNAEEQLNSLRILRNAIAETGNVHTKLYEDIEDRIKRAIEATDNFENAQRNIANIERITNPLEEPPIFTPQTTEEVVKYTTKQEELRKSLLMLRNTLFSLEDVEAGTFGFDPVEGSTEHCVKHYLTRNILNPDDPERGIYGFYIAPNQHRGIPNDKYISRLEAVSEVTRKLCRPAGLGWDVRLDLENDRYVFDIYEPIDKTENQNENNIVIFAPFMLNTESINYVHGNSNEKNAIYAVNGNSDEPFVQLVNRHFNNPASGIDRREVSVNINSGRHSTDYDEIEAFALKSAEDMVETESFEVSCGSIADYGTLYELGDKCTFKYKNLVLNAVITEAHTTFSEGSKRIKISTGDKKPSHINATNNSAAITRSDLRNEILNRKNGTGGIMQNNLIALPMSQKDNLELWNTVPEEIFGAYVDFDNFDTFSDRKPVPLLFYKFTSNIGTKWTLHSISFGLSLGRIIEYIKGMFYMSGGNIMFFSKNGVEWIYQNKGQLPFNQVNGMASNNTIIVVVSRSSTYAPCYSEDGGITYKAANIESRVNFTSVAFGYDKNNNEIFVGVGSNTGRSVAYSYDGINWKTVTPPSSNGWNNITYANGVFFATSGNRGMYSDDGINWNQILLSGITVSTLTYAKGMFVALGLTSSGINYVLTSLDGINWNYYENNIQLEANNSWNKIIYGNGIFVAIRQNPFSTSGDEESYENTMISYDGITWTFQKSFKNSWVDIAYGDRRFVAISELNAIYNQLITSP